MKWLFNARVDLSLILLPPFLSVIVVALLPQSLRNGETPLWAWALLVMGIDVSHVYSTLYRTYFDPEEFAQRRTLYLVAPLVCFIGGVAAYSFGAAFFWRILAYLAVYHFIRQQFGFMRLYSRLDEASAAEKRLDWFCIHIAAFYPVVYWHAHLPRNFNWFVEGDFLALNLPILSFGVGVLYIAALLLYVAKEIKAYQKGRAFNWGKHLVLVGTAVSWYAGIVAYNADFAFTLINVVSHGVPYMALIWIYGQKKNQESPLRPAAFWFKIAALPAFVGLLLVVAYFEESLWDVWVWHERPSLFPVGWYVHWSDSWLLFIVPLLSLPQTTHYILDGFIWKKRK